jgi:mRNA interferase MazF
MAVVTGPTQYDVWLVELDPTRGSEMRKTRPCLVVSPDDMNQYLKTVIVAPMTTVERAYPTRVSVKFQGKRGQVALDQLRAIDQERLLKRLGTLHVKSVDAVALVLLEMFSRS